MLTYAPNPVHRNRTMGKSQWSITINDENVSFSRAVANAWLIGQQGWGLHYPTGRPEYLGVAQDHVTQVFIAKFVGAGGVWHGYPADHQQNQHDIPDPSVLQKWEEAKFLSRAKVRKINRGQSCLL